MKINALNCCCPPKKQSFKQSSLKEDSMNLKAKYLTKEQQIELKEFQSSAYDTWDKLDRLKIDSMILREQNQRILRALQYLAISHKFDNDEQIRTKYADKVYEVAAY